MTQILPTNSYSNVLTRHLAFTYGDLLSLVYIVTNYSSCFRCHMDFVLIRESFKPFKLTEYCACESQV